MDLRLGRQRLGPAGKQHLGEPLPVEWLPAGQVAVADEHRGLTWAAGLGGGQDKAGVVGGGRRRGRHGSRRRGNQRRQAEDTGREQGE